MYLSYTHINTIQFKPSSPLYFPLLYIDFLGFNRRIFQARFRTNEQLLKMPNLQLLSQRY